MHMQIGCLMQAPSLPAVTTKTMNLLGHALQACVALLLGAAFAAFCAFNSRPTALEQACFQVKWEKLTSSACCRTPVGPKVMLPHPIR
jgi:hypothetical protein